jgi:hypothetical protein
VKSIADAWMPKWFEFLAPCQGAIGNVNGFRGCRDAQSPANFWHRFAVAERLGQLAKTSDIPTKTSQKNARQGGNHHQLPSFPIKSQGFWIFLFQPALEARGICMRGLSSRPPSRAGQEKQSLTAKNSRTILRLVRQNTMNDLRYLDKNQSEKMRC